MNGHRKAYVVGAGPNGLAAAITLAQAGMEVVLLEAGRSIGGGCRSEGLTLPGFVHDVCSAVHPMACASPFLSSLPLHKYGLDWIQPPTAVAHPLDGGRVVTLENSINETARLLGTDGPAYRRTLQPFIDGSRDLFRDILAPLHWPDKPLMMAGFGILAGAPAAWSARVLFRTEQARALVAGLSGHSILPLESLASGAVGWVLAIAAHHVGWPVPRGGSQKIADALAEHLSSLGGKIVTGRNVKSLEEVQDAQVALFDVTPAQFVRIAGNRIPNWFCRKLERYKYGPGVFKLDWALNGPIPWVNEKCARAATVHVGGNFAEIAAAERDVWHGRVSQRPFVLLAQPSLFDSSRAPEGKHTAWAYCHVPNGSPVDMTERIETQIERFAPGFRSRILARHTMGPRELQSRNANLVGGDITGGSQEFGQLFFRPTRMMHRTPLPGLYLCSSSTPPGAGVHGMCGYNAAVAALKDAGMPVPPLV